MRETFTDKEKELLDNANIELEKFKSKVFEMGVHPAYLISLMIIECVETAYEFYPTKPEKIPFGIPNYKMFLEGCLKETIKSVEEKNGIQDIKTDSK
jgi:hypothetical protein